MTATEWTGEGARWLRAAADALEACPPMLRHQYVAALRLYADEPWRIGEPMKCKHCGQPVYQYEYKWRHTNGMYVCTLQVPPARRDTDWIRNKAEPAVPTQT
jgi:hypothetical protein